MSYGMMKRRYGEKDVHDTAIAIAEAAACRFVSDVAPSSVLLLPVGKPNATGGGFRFVVEHLARHFKDVYGIPTKILPDVDYPSEHNPGSFGRLTRAVVTPIAPDLVSTAQAAADAREMEVNRERQVANGAIGAASGHLGGASSHLGGASGHLGGAYGHLGGGGAENGAKAKHATKSIEQLGEDGRVIATFPSLKAALAVTSQGAISKVLDGHRQSAGGYGWRLTATPLPSVAPSPLAAASSVNGMPPPPSPLDEDAVLGMIDADDDLGASPPPHSERGGAAAASPPARSESPLSAIKPMPRTRPRERATESNAPPSARQPQPAPPDASLARGIAVAEVACADHRAPPAESLLPGWTPRRTKWILRVGGGDANGGDNNAGSHGGAPSSSSSAGALSPGIGRDGGDSDCDDDDGADDDDDDDDDDDGDGGSEPLSTLPRR